MLVICEQHVLAIVSKVIDVEDFDLIPIENLEPKPNLYSDKFGFHYQPTSPHLTSPHLLERPC